jgi:hypothetical protein
MIRFKKGVNTRQKVYRLSMMNSTNSTRILVIRWFITTPKWSNPMYNEKDYNKIKANLSRIEEAT